MKTKRSNTGAKPAGSVAYTWKRVGETLIRHSRTKVYYLRVKRQGKQLKRSLRTTDLQLAKRKAKAFLDQIDSGPIYSSELSRNTSFETLANLWLPIRTEGLKIKSSKRVKVSVDALLPYFGKLAVSRISQIELDKWQVSRGKQISTSTFNRERCELISVMDFAVEKRLINKNPARPDPGFRVRGLKPKRSKSKHPYILLKSEFHKLINEVRMFNNEAPKEVTRPFGLLDPRTQEAGNLSELLAYSGMRIGKAINLKWGDVQFAGNFPSMTIR